MFKIRTEVAKSIGYVFLVVLVASAANLFIPKALNGVKTKITNGEPKKFGSIVRLTHDGRTFCTGTVVSPNLIFTAAHCVLSQTPFGTFLNDAGIEIRPDSNVATGVIARPIYATQQMDQAILTGDFSAFEARPAITDPEVLTQVKAGDEFLSCGYPLNGALFCTKLVYMNGAEFFWAVKGVLIPGMSGGPTMRADGAVMCVNTAVEKDHSIVSPLYNLNKSLPERK